MHFPYAYTFPLQILKNDARQLINSMRQTNGVNVA